MTEPFVEVESEEPEGPVGEVVETDRLIRQKIIHTLSIYPKLSPSMLQVGVGTGLKPNRWKPILHDMIRDGTIIQLAVTSESPGGRNQVCTVLSLANA